MFSFCFVFRVYFSSKSGMFFEGFISRIDFVTFGINISLSDAKSKFIGVLVEENRTRAWGSPASRIPEQ